MTEPDRGSGVDEELRRTALAVVVKSYENYKSHARFQETQRSWFLVPYMGIVGVVGAAVMNRLLRPPELDDSTRSILFLSLVALILLGFLVGAAIVKVGVVFQRQYDRAELLVRELQRATCADRDLEALLRLSMLPTLARAHGGGGGLRGFLARRGSVAAIHIYLISALIGAEATGAAALLLENPGWSLLAFPVATAAASFLLGVYRSILSAPAGSGAGAAGADSSSEQAAATPEAPPAGEA